MSWLKSVFVEGHECMMFSGLFRTCLSPRSCGPSQVCVCRPNRLLRVATCPVQVELNFNRAYDERISYSWDSAMVRGPCCMLLKSLRKYDLQNLSITAVLKSSLREHTPPSNADPPVNYARAYILMSPLIMLGSFLTYFVAIPSASFRATGYHCVRP